MFIFGFGKREFKVLGETEAKKCENCSHERPFKYVHEKRWFSFFFIPIFPYKERDLLVCSVCGAGIEDKEGVPYTKLGQVSEKPDRESILRSIKDKLERGEITRNEYIRMVNVLNFES